MLHLLKPFEPILKRKYRYYMFHGGRGGAKSYNTAIALLYLGLENTLRILCTREIQNTIKDSVHKLLSDIISISEFSDAYEVKTDSVRCITGSEFIFKGLRSSPNEIKSMEGIDICWCFVAGTKVDNKNIEDIQVGDVVNSLNHQTGEIEKKKVIKAMKREAPNILYELLTHCGSHGIIGTSEHPIFVKNKGYVSLRNIKKGDIVYASETKFARRSSLFGWMWGNDKNRFYRQKEEFCQKRRDILYGLRKKNCINENENKQPDEQSHNKRKDEKVFNRYEAQTKNIGWQWQRISEGAKTAVEKIGAWLVGRACCPNRPLQRRKLPSEQLQDRYCKHLLWNSHRNRRKLSLRSNIKSGGRKENKVFTEQRVESVEIQKQDDIRKLGLSDKGNFVYNIEVEDNNNYFANGLLVHNCEEAQSVSKNSIDILVPTIRKENSMIIATFNRKLEKDPIYVEFCENPSPNTYICKTTWRDNPFISDTLLNEMRRCKQKSLDDYLHIWEGEPERNPGGRIIKKEWFKYYSVLPKIEYKIIVADTAQKTKEVNDWTVMQCWGIFEGCLYLIDQLRAKLEAPELRRDALNFWRKHAVIDPANRAHLRKMYVEDKVSGTGLIQELKKEGIPIEGIERHKDKYTRVLDVVGYIEAGRVRLPERAIFLHDFLYECDGFRGDMKHEFDDIVDVLTDAINLAMIEKTAPIYGIMSGQKASTFHR